MYPHRLLIHIQHRIGNFGLLTGAILLMMVVRPFLSQQGEEGLLSDIMFLAIFLSGIYAARREQYGFPLAILLAGAGLAGRIHLRLSDPEDLPILVNVSALLFFTHALWNVAAHIWTERNRVNHDVIFAAISAYLLLGLIWGYAFFFLEMAQPHSFKGANAVLNRGDFSYFSFVTLSTLGYGDIVPISYPARSLAVVEAITGQLFLAVLIGRLVGAYVSQYRKPD